MWRRWWHRMHSPMALFSFHSSSVFTYIFCSLSMGLCAVVATLSCLLVTLVCPIKMEQTIAIMPPSQPIDQQQKTKTENETKMCCAFANGGYWDYFRGRVSCIMRLLICFRLTPTSTYFISNCSITEYPRSTALKVSARIRGTQTIGSHSLDQCRIGRRAKVSARCPKRSSFSDCVR